MIIYTNIFAPLFALIPVIALSFYWLWITICYGETTIECIFLLIAGILNLLIINSFLKFRDQFVWMQYNKKGELFLCKPFAKTKTSFGFVRKETTCANCIHLEIFDNETKTWIQFFSFADGYAYLNKLKIKSVRPGSLVKVIFVKFFFGGICFGPECMFKKKCLKVIKKFILILERDDSAETNQGHPPKVQEAIRDQSADQGRDQCQPPK